MNNTSKQNKNAILQGILIVVLFSALSLIATYMVTSILLVDTMLNLINGQWTKTIFSSMPLILEISLKCLVVSIICYFVVDSIGNSRNRNRASN